MKYTNISPALFMALRKKLAQDHDTEVYGDKTGRITGHGVTANWTYNGTDTLELTVVKHPFFMPAGAVYSAITHHIDELRGGSTPEQQA